ncbi:MAG: tetratricopeptide repeat protein [Chloroherpetonaceae bacterium]|nr:tetratricopeptide repeat protein [Chloroherpetonaceae bacterium]MDW8018739.1 tetratricopeptide repeat protein [Chloroherpetonaceae bacterium]
MSTFYRCIVSLCVAVALASSAWAQSDLDAARKAVRKNPKNPIAHYNLGVALANAEAYGEAVDAFQHAIRLNPNFAEAHYSLGLTYSEMERYSEAVQALRTAMRLQPSLPELGFNLAVLLSQTGAHTEAVGVLKGLRTVKDSVRYYQTLGNIAMKSDSTTADAIFAFERLTLLLPEQLENYQFLGDAYRKAKRYDEAVRTYERILEKDPNNESAIYAIGVTFVLSRQRAAAFKQHEKLERLKSPLAQSLIEYIFIEMPKRQDSTEKK